MTRRRAVEFTILAVLAATVVILLLNHLEEDNYSPSSDLRFDEDLPAWVSPTLTHHCETCGNCSHAFATSECRIRVTVKDRDGWYRLFWAGAEIYTYDDAADVGRALRNRTAELVEGSWIVRGEYAPGDHPGPHACTPAANRVELTYRLRREPYPGPGDPALDPGGTVAVPRRLLWFRYAFPPDRVDDFWWELENPDTFAGENAQPCPCGK